MHSARSRLLDRHWFMVLTVALFAAILAGAWFIGSHMERAEHKQYGATLTTVLASARDSVVDWADDHKAVAARVASTSVMRSLAAELRSLEAAPAKLRASALHDAVRAEVADMVGSAEVLGYAIVSPSGTYLTSSRPAAIGSPADYWLQSHFVDTITAGGPAMSLPLLETGQPREQPTAALVERPWIYAGAPIIDLSGDLVGTFALRLEMSEFLSILRLAQGGLTGETYAFDRDGRLLSQSKFEPQLVEAGLLSPGQSSILNIEIRDPGVDLTAGETTDVPVEQRPLTRMAAAAVAGRPGTDLEGYPDYRGIPVIGAWLWEDSLEIGLTTEIDVAEAYASLQAAKGSISALTAGVLLVLIAYAIAILRSR